MLGERAGLEQRLRHHDAIKRSSSAGIGTSQNTSNNLAQMITWSIRKKDKNPEKDLIALLGVKKKGEATARKSLTQIEFARGQDFARMCGGKDKKKRPKPSKSGRVVESRALESKHARRDSVVREITGIRAADGQRWNRKIRTLKEPTE